MRNAHTSDGSIGRNTGVTAPMLSNGRITAHLDFSQSQTLGVLLVDPDANHLALWGSLLSYVGYRVSCARSAFEATLYLSGDVQCVVVSDRLPDFDSVDYVRRLRVAGEREFVLLAEELTPCIAVEASEAGAGAVLARPPASLQEMVDAIESVCSEMSHALPVHVETASQQLPGPSAKWLARSA